MKSVFVFFDLVFGFIIFCRLLGEMRTQKLIGEKLTVHLKLSFLFWIFFCSMLPFSNTITISLLVWLPIIFLFLIPKWIITRHKDRFRAEFISILNQIILNMNNGLALRPAILTSCSHLTDFSRNKIEKIVESLNLSTPSVAEGEHDILARYLIAHFKKIEKDTHLSVLRVVQLRNRFKSEETFRIKKNRALGAAKAQFIVLSILYSMTLIYVIGHQNGSENVKIIFYSLILYFLGSLVATYVTRSFKWTV